MLEYTAALKYVQHSATVTGPEYFGIIDEMVKHSQEEMNHAKILSDYIQYLGGVPEANIYSIEIYSSSKDMLNDDFESELESIRRYKKRILEADFLGLPEVRRALEDILLEEIEHENDLAVILGK